MLILCPILRDEPGRAGGEKAEAIRDMIEFKIERKNHDPIKSVSRVSVTVCERPADALLTRPGDGWLLCKRPTINGGCLRGPLAQPLNKKLV
jgi:hypothetical protein